MLAEGRAQSDPPSVRVNNGAADTPHRRRTGQGCAQLRTRKRAILEPAFWGTRAVVSLCASVDTRDIAAGGIDLRAESLLGLVKK